MATQLAVQLYTLRNFCKTPVDIAATLARIARLGYKSVQASALGPIEPIELKKILDDNGLTCCATHKPWEAYRDQTQKMIDDHQTLGCKYTALGAFMPKPEEFNRSTWTKFVDEFNAVAAKMKAGGVQLGYHNHHTEFANLDGPGTETAYDFLNKNLSSDCWFEVDTYWVQFAGGDPAAWIERFKGRLPCVHLKDLGIANDRSQEMRPVGRGNLNWDRILQACKTAGVEWYIVEQDNCNGLDPFECLQASRDFLVARGFD
jgi:sugar phosphate isomerase/epimerase